ncbi:uncharacterized protein VTP21DRAFT_11526 [Calcarisporiella thermophila]|uniref:uncharacterized protein n=1 Tax=Calcarisporiella thermophila TaxID=911321 RepID=UPI0037444844
MSVLNDTPARRRGARPKDKDGRGTSGGWQPSGSTTSDHEYYPNIGGGPSSYPTPPHPATPENNDNLDDDYSWPINENGGRGKRPSTVREGAERVADNMARPYGVDKGDKDSFSGPAYTWPILFALLPPMGSALFGRAEAWTDFLFLSLIAWFLYTTLRVPWEMYYEARQQRVNVERLAPTSGPVDPEHENVAHKLRKQEFHSLLFVLASPFLGAWGVNWAMSRLASEESYTFPTHLFVLAASIRPILHLVALAKERARRLQSRVNYPETEIDALRERLNSLEVEMEQLSRNLALKRDISEIRTGVEPLIEELQHIIRRHEKKERRMQGLAEERFAVLEAKLREHEAKIAKRLEEQRISFAAWVLRWVLLPVTIMVRALTFVQALASSRDPLLLQQEEYHGKPERVEKTHDCSEWSNSREREEHIRKPKKL